jgi:hypothetical protein
MGQCPSCGEKIPINRDTTSRTPQARASVETDTRNRWGTRSKPSLDAKQRFGRAVDLYCAGYYGEALAIFDALQHEFPDSVEIERARRQCLDARNRDPIHLPGPATGQVAGDELDEGTLRALRRIAVEKMLHGSSDAVQLQAAELVARMAGVLDASPRSAPEKPYSPSPADVPPGNGSPHGDAGGNGHAGGTGDHANGPKSASHPGAERG